MEPNEPIGIPSGWEEIAAFELFSSTGLSRLLKYNWLTAKTVGQCYVETYGHDWRVEE